MTVHCMLDLETVGLRPGCAILSIGAVLFDVENGVRSVDGTFKCNVTRESCAEARLSFDPKTEEWWDAQSNEAKAALYDPEPVHLLTALDDFVRFYEKSGVTTLWSHGAATDVPWLEAAFHACNITPPWNYRAPRDTRTLYDLDPDFEPTKATVEHCALSDAVAQATDVVRVLRLLKLKTSASG